MKGHIKDSVQKASIKHKHFYSKNSSSDICQDMQLIQLKIVFISRFLPSHLHFILFDVILKEKTVIVAFMALSAQLKTSCDKIKQELKINFSLLKRTTQSNQWFTSKICVFLTVYYDLNAFFSFVSYCLQHETKQLNPIWAPSQKNKLTTSDQNNAQMKKVLLKITTNNPSTPDETYL